MTDHIVIVAAGTGSRYGGRLPKQFCDLNGRPLLMTTLERLHCCMPEAELTVVLSEGMMADWRQMCREASFALPHSIVAGGATRALSVRNALSFIESMPGEKRYIAVHDAARPVVSRGLIERLVAALAPGDADGAIPSCPLTDSIRLIDPDGSSEAADRSLFRTVQTPQIFPAEKLFEANRRMLPPGDDDCAASGSLTDDASVMEAAGFSRLILTEGDPRNIKVTNPGDMAVAALYLAELAQ